MLISLLCSVVVSASASANPINADEARSVFDYVQPRVRYTNLAVATDVLQGVDIQRWAGILQASDAQLQLMRNEYGRFVEQHNALLDREAPRLLARSSEIHRAQVEEGGYTDAHSDRMKALIRQSAQLRRQMEQLEQSYIRDIEPFLTDEQVDRLPLLRNEAVRRQCRIRVTHLPWAHLDVRLLWEQVDDAWLSPEEREWVSQILWEHDQAVTPLLWSMTDTFWRATADAAPRVVQWQSGMISSEEFNRLGERARQPFLRSLLRLAAVNESAVMQIVETIPKSVGREFLLIAKSASYPQLYPDRSSLHSGFRAMLDDEQVDTQLIQSLFETYSMEYDQLSNRAELFYHEWGKLNALARDGCYNQHLTRALEPTHKQRIEFAQRWLEQLSDTLGEEALLRHGLVDIAEPEEAVDEIEAASELP